ncbi:hydrogenase 2 operon protein HybA [Edwardsiella piscicida]|uniref:Hydrogenase-2 operon protein hybA n=3 Tax=Edwardsiella TaxID=635 RepID=A0A0H3DWC4_EDWTF|nr:hydrogenase 2 operon protein HybA [Edwardsiella piscicida]ACY85201.1 hydrogenase 2 protein [Edwardsiella tarda EIB202]ADM42244.1 Hydrogenase-2 operon protein hybA precursor [Edwardsiella tarda FL6-60]AGH74356.1 hydrogenase 2 protein HybA [Edwardsiella piscicida C07-087]AOP43563.1 hydrogenase 2 operon protein HybA [Edwardsiella piscicida]ARD19380.1 hydrogenase 2 protein HybA [Edwardsiella piscicida]
MNRRNFLKFASVGALAAGTAASGSAQAAAENKPPIPTAVGMLYDSTLCVGCQACVAECQRLNKNQLNPNGDPIWSNNDKLTPYTNNIIQVWRDGTGVNKDQVENGYAYIKKQCMHCVDPNCVSVCPVSALRKDPKTGIVTYDPDVCTGCRYCMVACPFDVPKYDYHNPFGALHKCELCNQKGLERIDQGKLPGCVEVCPAGAVIYGTREELLAEAKKRLAARPGAEYAYPRQTLHSNDSYQHPVAHYQPYVYGEKEGGGTQVLVLAGVPYAKLGMPQLDELSTGARSEHIQHTLYKGMILPLVVLAGLSVMTYRNTKNHHDGDDDNE